jgi:HNH endonuclease
MSFERFMAKVRHDTNGCWIWVGAVHSATGYGRFALDGHKVIGAHRAAWLLFRGEIPRGRMVCHHCDIKSCVNPDHLFLGSQTDNMSDALRKGRLKCPAASYASDESHQRSLLTNEQVREIRDSSLNASQLHASGRYPVCHSALRRVKGRRTYRDV